MKGRNRVDSMVLTVKHLLPRFENQHYVANSITNRM